MKAAGAVASRFDKELSRFDIDEELRRGKRDAKLSIMEKQFSLKRGSIASVCWQRWRVHARPLPTLRRRNSEVGLKKGKSHGKNSWFVVD
jgi:hypothetical protein